MKYEMASSSESEELKEAERQITRIQIASLRDEFKRLRRQGISLSSQEFSQKLTTVHNFAEKVEDAETGLKDSEMVREFAGYLRDEAERVGEKRNRFNLTEYAIKTGQEIGGMPNSSGMFESSVCNWSNFGRSVARVYRRAPHLNYIYGSFDIGEKNKEEKTISPRKVVKLGVKCPATKVTHREADEANEDKVDFLVKQVEQQLMITFQKNQGTVGFFEFVIDPTDFGRTVENIFHVSFLVKRNKAFLWKDPETGLPQLSQKCPKIDSKQSPSDSTTNPDGSEQALLSISMGNWRDLTRLLKIKEPMIKLKYEENVTVKKLKTENSRK